MSLQKSGIIYGRSGNDLFDTAAIEMLYEAGERIKDEDFMSKIPIERGTVPGSDYYRQVLGNVEVIGYDKPLKKTCKVQYVTIWDRGVSEHPHDEGEWYFIPEKGDEGVLTLGIDNKFEDFKLTEGNNYYIQPNISHSLTPVSTLLRVLVFKFSPELIDNFNKTTTLNLKIASLDSDSKTGGK